MLWTLRLAAFSLGIVVSFPTAHAEKTCWRDARGVWTCAHYSPRGEWGEHERHHDWRHQEPFYEEHERHWHNWRPAPFHREEYR